MSFPLPLRSLLEFPTRSRVWSELEDERESDDNDVQQTSTQVDNLVLPGGPSGLFDDEGNELLLDRFEPRSCLSFLSQDEFDVDFDPICSVPADYAPGSLKMDHTQKIRSDDVSAKVQSDHVAASQHRDELVRSSDLVYLYPSDILRTHTDFSGNTFRSQRTTRSVFQGRTTGNAKIVDDVAQSISGDAIDDEPIEPFHNEIALPGHVVRVCPPVSSFVGKDITSVTLNRATRWMTNRQDPIPPVATTAAPPLVNGVELEQDPVADTRNSTTRHKKRHCRFFGHGKRWTALAFLVSWTGVALSLMSRRSTEFVHLGSPLRIVPLYDPVYEMGMMRIKICYDSTVASKTGCEVIDLTSDDVDDGMFESARLFLSLANMFGAFFTIFLTTALCWESINLRPIGYGYLFTYFFQSFSMLFFDSNICSEKKCRLGPGCLYSIIASFCWIAACIATAKMDSFKLQARRKRRRFAREQAKLVHKAAKRALLQRKVSNATNRTSSSTSSESSEEDIEVGRALASQGLYAC